LTPQAKLQVDALLALEPGATLASISNWADLTRNKATARWHYVNVPRDSACQYLPSRDCPDDECVVAAIERQVQRLASGASPTERLNALKYVVHFVGDVHQPLHAAFADDRGGNSYQLQAFGKGTNLHAVWDTALISEIEPSAGALADKLDTPHAPKMTSTSEAGAWASESCQVVSRPTFYPGHKLQEAYLAEYRPVLERRLYEAGVRLAATLNQVLGVAPAR
jgi:hypothetical protein